MEGRFYVDRCTRITRQENYGSPPVLGPNRPVSPRQFVIQIEGLLGADSEPDALFFVESWTLGVTAAVESFHKRRRGHVDQELYSNTLDNFDNLRGQSFVQERELNAEFLSSAPYRRDPGVHDAECPPQPQEETSAWTEGPAPREWETTAEEYAGRGETTRPMTQERACDILGVAAPCTRGEIKAAYRQMVGRWHPDRLGSMTEGVRRSATEKMAVINAAYRLLCSGLRKESP